MTEALKENNQTPKSELKKFQLVWDERVVDSDGDTLHFQQKSQIIEALSEDDACKQWEDENEYNENQNGLDSCYEIVEHDLFKKNVFAEMPDGFTYALPVEFIARNRAEHFSSKFDWDVTRSLKEDTLPFFESNEAEILKWATENIKWQEVCKEASKYSKKISDDILQDHWSTKTHKIL